jgi:putative copper resistance protein D
MQTWKQWRVTQSTQCVVGGIILVLFLVLPTDAQLHQSEHNGSHGHTPAPAWEGSPEGKAYSEFNHHLAGSFVLLIGLAELRTALGISAFAWSRFLLPIGMLSAAAYLFVWSDHDAWPIGGLSFGQTFFAGDLEIVQHKIYAVLLLAIGVVESLRRLGRIKQPIWATPLPVFAIIAGLLLFLHQHGDHPGAQRIVLNHMIMGTMAVLAGSLKLTTGPAATVSAYFKPRIGWHMAWPALIFLIALQLLLYAE